MNFERWNSFPDTNTSQFEAKLTYIRLNIQTPCPPSAFAQATARGAVALPRPAIALSDGGSRLTRGVVRGSFTRHARIAFGHGCNSVKHSRAAGAPVSGRLSVIAQPRVR